MEKKKKNRCQYLILVGGKVEEGKGWTFYLVFLLLVLWGSQKHNKEKIQILKHKWQEGTHRRVSRGLAKQTKNLKQRT